MRRQRIVIVRSSNMYQYMRLGSRPGLPAVDDRTGELKEEEIIPLPGTYPLTCGIRVVRLQGSGVV